jgi:hypothetical protein
MYLHVRRSVLSPRSLLFRLLLAAAFVVNVPAVWAQAFANVTAAQVDYSRAEASPGKSCEAMGGYQAKDIVAIRTEHIPATDSVPEHCRITGLLAPEIAFEVSLPARWNGRFYMIGNGGLAGESLEDPFRTSQRDRALQLGFAFAQTNTGHDARKEPGGTFVLSNPQKAMDYAYWAVHVTATTAKTLTAGYYSKPITRSYWNSCSNGGRQGLIEAQRYPQDFDGLVVNAPWVDQTGYTIGSLWNQRAVSAAHLTPAKLALLARHVMAKCDAIDGLEDGLIDDPRKCSFDARRDVPQCTAGTDTDACLTPAQAEAVMKVYGGPRSHGRTLFPGYMPGSEALVRAPVGNAPAASAWMNFIVAAQPDRVAADFNLAENTMRYLVFTPPQPQYDYHTFDFDRDAHLLDSWGKEVNATNTDLTKFHARGGKLLMTYGWADQVLEPLMGVNYYEHAVARNGSGTRGFFRLFMVPGMNHCSGGIGTDQFDPMTAVIDWVEKGKAPDVLLAARVVDKRVVRTRPLCPYPQVARYQGHGSIDAAENFRCVAP